MNSLTELIRQNEIKISTLNLFKMKFVKSNSLRKLQEFEKLAYTPHSKAFSAMPEIKTESGPLFYGPQEITTRDFADDDQEVLNSVNSGSNSIFDESTLSARNSCFTTAGLEDTTEWLSSNDPPEILLETFQFDIYLKQGHFGSDKADTIVDENSSGFFQLSSNIATETHSIISDKSHELNSDPPTL